MPSIRTSPSLTFVTQPNHSLGQIQGTPPPSPLQCMPSSLSRGVRQFLPPFTRLRRVVRAHARHFLHANFCTRKTFNKGVFGTPYIPLVYTTGITGIKIRPILMRSDSELKFLYFDLKNWSGLLIYMQSDIVYKVPLRDVCDVKSRGWRKLKRDTKVTPH